MGKTIYPGLTKPDEESLKSWAEAAGKIKVSDEYAGPITRINEDIRILAFRSQTFTTWLMTLSGGLRPEKEIQQEVEVHVHIAMYSEHNTTVYYTETMHNLLGYDACWDIARHVRTTHLHAQRHQDRQAADLRARTTKK